MLKAIRKARSTICFETYIYWEGEIGQQFADALVDRATAGVTVHVLLDWLGTAKIDTKYLERMEQAGIEVERYHPVRWHNLDRINNRTHRKLLTLDGRVGFIGGVGIADKWAGDAQDPEHWRDLHFRVEGPGVGQMQAAFMDNWMKTRSRVLHEANYFPELQAAGECCVQVFKSSPRGQREPAAHVSAFDRLRTSKPADWQRVFRTGLPARAGTGRCAASGRARAGHRAGKTYRYRPGSPGIAGTMG